MISTGANDRSGLQFLILDGFSLELFERRSTEANGALGRLVAQVRAVAGANRSLTTRD
jgi:hypothetical protein